MLRNSLSKSTRYIVYGYTIVELMVAMIIMVVLFSVSYARFRDFQKRQIMENFYQDMKADLRFAQELALSNRKPQLPAGNPCLNSNLSSYTFKRISATSYEIDANCSSDVLVKGPIDLPIGMTIQGFGSNSVIFNVLGRGVQSAVPPIQVVLRWSGTGLPDKTITITSSGTIE